MEIGYGLRPTHPLEKDQKNAATPAGMKPITFEEFAKAVEPYTVEYTEKLSGVPAAKLKRLAELYADPKQKVVSYWTMGLTNTLAARG